MYYSDSISDVPIPEHVVESVVHTKLPTLCTSESPLGTDPQLAAAPDTTASWEQPSCWWECHQEAEVAPSLMSPPEPSGSTAPSSVQSLPSGKRPMYSYHKVMPTDDGKDKSTSSHP